MGNGVSHRRGLRRKTWSEFESSWERVVGIKLILRGASDPRPPGYCRLHRVEPANGSRAHEPAGEPRPYERLVDKIPMQWQLPAGEELGHPRGRAGAAG